MSDIVEHYHDRLRKLCLAFYAGFLVVGFVHSLYQPLSMVAVIGFICVWFAYLYYVSTFAGLVGKSPLTYVFVCMVLSIIGQGVTYFLLRKSVLEKNLIWGLKR